MWRPPCGGSNSAWLMVSMFCRSRHSLLMPWKILQIGELGRTVEQFVCDVARAKILAITSFSLLIVLLMYRPPAQSRGIPRTRNSSTTWSGLSTLLCKQNCCNMLIPDCLYGADKGHGCYMPRCCGINSRVATTRGHLFKLVIEGYFNGVQLL